MSKSQVQPCLVMSWIPWAMSSVYMKPSWSTCFRPLPPALPVVPIFVKSLSMVRPGWKSLPKKEVLWQMMNFLCTSEPVSWCQEEQTSNFWTLYWLQVGYKVDMSQLSKNGWINSLIWKASSQQFMSCSTGCLLFGRLVSVRYRSRCGNIQTPKLNVWAPFMVWSAKLPTDLCSALHAQDDHLHVGIVVLQLLLSCHTSF